MEETAQESNVADLLGNPGISPEYQSYCARQKWRCWPHLQSSPGQEVLEKTGVERLMKSIVKFADDKIRKAFLELKDSDDFDRKLHEWIQRAINDIEENASCGLQVKKKQIPKEYIKKFGISNLWIYDLPKGWRLMYSISANEVQIITILLEWLDHKEYEKRFKY